MITFGRFRRVHTKNTKEKKITKRNQGVFVCYLIVKLSISDSLQQSLYSLLCVLGTFVFFV